MTRSADNSRNLVLVFAVAAVATFLMAAAASTIVAQADGPSEREAAFAANSVVINDVGQPIGSVPAGVRVPSLVEVDLANMFSAEPLEAPTTGDESVKTVLIGISEDLKPEALIEAFLNHSQSWLQASSKESTRVRNAAIDVGVRLRRLDVHALILPTGFLAANGYACDIAKGLYSGGAVPVFRFPAASPADTGALNKCLAYFIKKDPTVFVDHKSGDIPELVQGLAPKLTMFFETTNAGVNSALVAGASGLLVEGESREATAKGLALTRSEAKSQLVLAASGRMSRWFADVPPIGDIPSKAAPAERKQEKRVKVKPLEDISPSRSGNDGRPVAPREPEPQQTEKKSPTPNPVPPRADQGGATGR